jgi:TolB-like protein/Tfp pilus assembly protein PilF
MVAVLPFQNLSGDPEQAYIGDGLTEEMIAELGRLDPGRLGVIARTSSMAYKGTTKSVADIARELGVDFVLEGSVRREAARVRIVAQLIRASDQTPVWAERYDRDLRSFLSLQREVTRAIAVQARLKLSAEAEARLGRGLDVHPEAYQAYSKGRFLLHQRTPDSIRKALQHFEEAVATDPGYAQAHAGLADAHELLSSYAGVAPRDARIRSMDAARRALELDAELSEPNVSLGIVHANYTWDWARAEEAFTRAIELNPSNALAHKGYAELLSVLARHDASLEEAKRAVELDPLSLLARANLGIMYYRARRYDDAVQQLRQTLSLDPNYMLAHFDLGLVFAAKGAHDEAISALQRATTLAPDFDGAIALLGAAYAKAGRIAKARAIGGRLQRLSAKRYVSGFVRGLYVLSLGKQEEALAELERAYEERSWLVTLLKVDPAFDPLRSSPRFRALLMRLKFPE